MSTSPLHIGPICDAALSIVSSCRVSSEMHVRLMDEIRRIFAEANKVDAAWFSFNSKGGCKVCKGTGQISYDMAFAEPVVVPCEECGGHRYNPKALSYRYKGMNIEDVMRLTIREAMEFFDDAKIRKLLKGLCDVGLDYLSLGQPTSTLSGGEVQRVKLASELGKRGNIYIMDEPSTGLHPSDTARLLALLRRLVADGNTVVIVEHKLSLIAQADWVIDMGPEGGADGGEVLFSGTPAELLSCPLSKTAQYLTTASPHHFKSTFTLKKRYMDALPFTSSQTESARLTFPKIVYLREAYVCVFHPMTGVPSAATAIVAANRLSASLGSVSATYSAHVGTPSASGSFSSSRQSAAVRDAPFSTLRRIQFAAWAFCSTDAAWFFVRKMRKPTLW